MSTTYLVLQELQEALPQWKLTGMEVVCGRVKDGEQLSLRRMKKDH